VQRRNSFPCFHWYALLGLWRHKLTNKWFKFWVSNWLGDAQLRLCSSEARGLFIDCLCLMHDAKRRGYLETSMGKPICDDMLARLTGTFKGDVYRCKQELIDSGVVSMDESGIIYSRKMVRDSMKAEKCADAGKKGGGNPILNEHDKKIEDKKIDDICPKVHPKVTFKGDLYRSMEFNAPALEEVVNHGTAGAGIPESVCREFWQHYETQGWKLGSGLPMVKWQSGLVKWATKQRAMAIEGKPANDKAQKKALTKASFERTRDEVRKRIERAMADLDDTIPADMRKQHIAAACKKARDAYGRDNTFAGLDAVETGIHLALGGR